ncbi:MAG: class I SAM-dependent DNA methyltransferase [Gemmatimonadales bacterium]|nr:class I SAM-dependent DNA methyltransferase [Gemmatimonadales bacterium]
MPLPTPAEVAPALRTLAERWATSTLGERQAFQSWFRDFCDALGVDQPAPHEQGTYCFEQPVKVITADGNLATNFIDCWKAGHFAVEAKATGNGEGPKDVPLRKAFKQLTQYVAAEPGTIPPYLMVVDVPRELIIWEGWRGGFGGFAAGRRILLDQLPDRPDDIALLQDIWTQPKVRDPRGKAQQVTRDTAGKLAELAAAFEDRGHDPERVARFLMRCVFCFFAEDVGLLPKKLFERTLETARETGDSAHVAETITALWRVMDAGGMFGADRIQQFNGHFFRTLESLPLEPADVQLLVEAAGFEWSGVEPSIFGTLLVRALEPAERHKLGAEYTPREYIERLVEPTVVEPLRERWSAVQARVTQLEQESLTAAHVNARQPDVAAMPPAAHVNVRPNAKIRAKLQAEAIHEVQSYHAWLRSLRFLDPACGSGNFLYVTMAAVKRIELEVLRELARLHGGQEGLVLDEVHPRQFHGIEVNWWAREIAELTLWIGYHQFWREAHGGRTPPVPILEDTGTIECRDAILAWDATVHRPEKDRPDPTPRIVHPVTGELVPDPAAKLPYIEYVGARQAEWPEADFIVGNPPYVGNKRMRGALGDGYVEALRGAYGEAFDGVDLFSFWWSRAAGLVARGASVRAGLITTNTVTQVSHHEMVTRAVEAGAELVWAVPDHPWTDDTDGAAVRVALSVLARSVGAARRQRFSVDEHGNLEATLSISSPRTFESGAAVAVAAQTALLANAGIGFRGYTVVGDGFFLSDESAAALQVDPADAPFVKRMINGRAISQGGASGWVIDLGLMTEAEARNHPRLFDILRARVQPVRASNARKSYRDYWWRFAEPRPALRDAIHGLVRHAITPMTARHRLFMFIDNATIADQGLIVVALDDAFQLGVLSSGIHSAWAGAAGGTLEDRPRYNNAACFDPFPFPDTSAALRESIGALAEKLDQHRKDAIARDERVTMTGMYNVVEKLRSGEALTPKERAIHEVAACSILRDMHDALDALVAEGYGWPWPMEKEEILERLVALHDERVGEEQRGVIRWLRPEYQIPRFAPDHVAELDLPAAEAVEEVPPAALVAWPATAVEQLAALQALVGRAPLTLEEAVAAFAGGDRKLVGRHLETLAMLGEVRELAGRFGG